MPRVLHFGAFHVPSKTAVLEASDVIPLPSKTAEGIGIGSYVLCIVMACTTMLKV